MPRRSPERLTVADVARQLGVSRAAIYCKVRVRSLTPIAGRHPYQFWSHEIQQYQAIRAAHQMPTWHGRLTATQVMQRYLALTAPRPVSIATLVEILHLVGVGRTWKAPRQTCGALLCRPGFRRVRRGWYTVEVPQRRPVV